jgi:hypothetical protein
MTGTFRLKALTARYAAGCGTSCRTPEPVQPDDHDRFELPRERVRLYDAGGRWCERW